MIVNLGNYLEWNDKIWQVVETTPYLILESPDNPYYSLANPNLEKLGFKLVLRDFNWMRKELDRVGFSGEILVQDDYGVAFVLGEKYIELNTDNPWKPPSRMYYEVYEDDDGDPILKIDSKQINSIDDFEIFF
jgi:hypothetical protein